MHHKKQGYSSLDILFTEEPLLQRKKIREVQSSTDKNIQGILNKRKREMVYVVHIFFWMRDFDSCLGGEKWSLFVNCQHEIYEGVCVCVALLCWGS